MQGLDDQEWERYDRQIGIDEWGQAGQEKIKSATVFIAGAGGLGSAAAFYLAAAGVGELAICDADQVELSNLNRQILHSENDLGRWKTESAGETLLALNSMIIMVTRQERLTQENVEKIVGKPNIVIDCLDNFETRYLLNDYCLQNGIAMIHAAVWEFCGQITFLAPPETPCLRCIFPKAPSQEKLVVCGSTPGLLGCLQAMEALKYLTGIGDNLHGRLLLVDGRDMSFETFKVQRNPECRSCGGLDH